MMQIILLMVTVLHVLGHIVPSAYMTYHMWHMHKFHGSKAKWKLISTILWVVISLVTMIELPDMIRSLSNHCSG